VRVLVVGASGLIGAAVAARLRAEGHAITGVARGRLPLGGVHHLRLDLAEARQPAVWLTRLQDIDAVVNCAGLLQDAPGESLQTVHIDAPRALFQACEQAGVRRVVQISALGVDRKAPTRFSQTKLEGDKALMARELDWVILRPSVVIGRAAYGGSALLRGLAALPIVPAAVDAGDIQPVHLDDLLDTIVFFLRPGAPARVALDLVGPKRFAFDALVALFRRWLGWPPARRVRAPKPLFALLYRLGDLAGALGWRPPLRSTARREVERGATGDPGPWIAATGRRPRDLEQTLLAAPATVQERWFARLYLVKPFVLAMIVLFWTTTGIIALGPGWGYGIELMNEGGVHGWPAAATVIGGALTDLAVGAAIAWRRTSERGLYVGALVTILYAVIGTILVPRLWADPLGPMLKVLPIVALHLAAMGMAEER
jgi:uncharacterized protein YbjT (DUF2867 family)